MIFDMATSSNLMFDQQNTYFMYKQHKQRANVIAILIRYTKRNV